MLTRFGPPLGGLGMTVSYSRIANEMSDWKRLILAARECRSKGNERGATALYKRALNCAKQAGVEYSEELISFLVAELWSETDSDAAPHPSYVSPVTAAAMTFHN